MLEFLSGLSLAVLQTELLAGIILFALAYRYILKPIGIWIKLISHAASEFRPNGGSTVKDAIDRIELRLMIISQRQRILDTDAPTGIFEASTVGDVTYVNRTFCRLVHRTPEELRGTGWINCVRQDVRDEVYSDWQSAIEQNREFFRTIPMVRPNGEVIQVMMKALVTRDTHGDAIEWIGTVVQEHGE